MKKLFLIFGVSCLVCLSATPLHAQRQKKEPRKITSINILDRNGMSQTISSKNRLAEYEQTDFLSPQPYQKVMRVYGKEKNGNVHAQITSYHPNGQIKQYLDAVNNRASGTYCEWYSNGQVKIQAKVIGGMADLNSQAEESWLFDGPTWAWDDEGHFLAEVLYDRGELEGWSRYFHPNEMLWKASPYHKGKLHGTESIYLENGSALQMIDYVDGQKEGMAYRYWNPTTIAYEETYRDGKLLEGRYFSKEGALISEIFDGAGKRAIFSKDGVAELQDYKKGIQEGLVEIFDERGHVVSQYSLKEGEKQGEETTYYPQSTNPKLLLTWDRGLLQGPVKTWYESGALESQREMSLNKKNGLFTAWYRNGSLMLVEEYESDKLIKGEYYRLGEATPVSKIEHGKGLATLFSSEGVFAKKVYYQEGRPLE